MSYYKIVSRAPSLQYIGICILLLILNGELIGQQDDRVFRDKNGRALRAVFVEAEQGFVKLIRSSDQRSFVLEINSLSEEDRIWIRSKVEEQAIEAREKGDFGDGWSRLIIKMPGVIDEPEIIGMNPEVVFRRLDAFTHDVILPRGAWVKIPLLTGKGILESLVRYEGAKHWDVSISEYITSISKDGGEEIPVGVSLPIEGAAQFIRGLGRSKFPGPVSIEIRNVDQFGMVPDIDIPVHAFIADDWKINESAMTRMCSHPVVALDIDLKYDDLGILNSSANIEALRFTMWDVPAKEVGDGSVGIDTIALPDLPNVRYLSLKTAAAPSDFAEILRTRVDKLQMLHFSVMSPRPEVAKWTGINFLRELECLHISDHIQVKASEIRNLINLKSISLGEDSLSGSPAEQSEMLPDSGLIHFFCDIDTLSADVWEKWGSRGNLSSVVRLRACQRFKLSWLKQVEVLYLEGSDSVAYMYPSMAGDLEALSKLQYLSIKFPDSDFVKTIGNLSNIEKIEAIRLDSFAEMEIPALGNLKRLILKNMNGTSPVLDLSQYRKLETFTGIGLHNIKRIHGIEKLPVLESIQITDAPVLSSLGDPVPGFKLKVFSAIGCESLPDLKLLLGCDSLQQLRLINCPKLQGPANIIVSNPLGFYHIQNSGSFEYRKVISP